MPQRRNRTEDRPSNYTIATGANLSFEIISLQPISRLNDPIEIITLVRSSSVGQQETGVQNGQNPGARSEVTYNDNSNNNSGDANNDFPETSSGEQVNQAADITKKWRGMLESLAESYLRYTGKINGHAADIRTNDLPGPDEQTDCSCEGEIRDVTVYFFSTAAVHRIKFCNCQPPAVALMDLGLMPVSPTRPVTAIHLGLMDYMMQQRDSAALSSQAIAKIYNDYHENYKEPLKRPLSDVICQNLIPIYMELQETADGIIESISKKYADDKVVCPACTDDYELYCQRFWTMDGNSSQKCEREHKDGVVRSKEMQSALSTLWVGPSVVEKYENEKGERESDPVDSRSRAASGSNRKRKKYPVNGVFAIMCSRHEIVLKMVDITSRGERYKYPLAVIDQLLTDAGIDGQDAAGCPKVHLMYDIICRLTSSLKKKFKGLMEKGGLALPALHAYAHVQHCQVQRNPLYVAEFGLTDGEANERLWSELNKFVAKARKMSQYNRRLVLYRAMTLRNSRKIKNLDSTLADKFDNAVKKKNEADSKLSNVTALDIQNAKKEWADHVKKAKKCTTYFKISSLLPVGLDDRTRYMLLLTQEQRTISNMSAHEARLDAQVTAIRKEMDELATKIKENDRDFSHPKNSAEIRECIEDAEENRANVLQYKKIVYKDAIRPVAKQYITDFEVLHSGHISKKSAELLEKSLQSTRALLTRFITEYNDAFNENIQFSQLTNKINNF